MAQWNFAATAAGKLLFADIHAGAVLIPTKIVIGTGNMPAGNRLADMAGAVSPLKEIPVSERKRTPDGMCIFGGVWTNADIAQDFYYRECALYARAEYRDADGTVLKSVDEVCMIYGSSGNTADLFPAYTEGSTLVERNIRIPCIVGNDADVEMVLESGIYATKEELEAATKLIDSSTGRKYAWGVENGLIYIEEVS